MTDLCLERLHVAELVVLDEQLSAQVRETELHLLQVLSPLSVLRLPLGECALLDVYLLIKQG